MTTTVAGTISVMQTFERKNIVYLLSSGFEGFMFRQWGRIGRVVRRPKTRIELMYELPLLGGSFEIIEDCGEKGSKKTRHVLDEEAILRGLTLMPKLCPSQWGAFLSNDYDAITGDVFIQCCVLGEVKYG